MNIPDKGKRITSVIIDDEELARKLILRYLEKHPQIEVVAECENGFTGLKAIGEFNPDLVFLDIQMPKINGFELLEILEEKPVVIFSTAHDEFAIKAFEHSAVDYLLKPYSQQRFDEAITKALGKIFSGQSPSGELNKLNDNIDQSREILGRVVIKTGTRVDVIPVDDIEYLQSADDYVEIFTGKERYLKQKTMSFFENHLDPEKFIRVHRSYIVAVGQIARLEPYTKETYVLTLKNGKEISVSKTGLLNLRERLKF